MLARENPPTLPGPPEAEEKALMFDGLKELFRRPDFVLLMVVFFMGLGTFNAVSTWIENIVSPRGFSSPRPVCWADSCLPAASAER